MTAWVEMPWVPESLPFPARMSLPTVIDGHVSRPTAPGLSMPTRGRENRRLPAL